MTAQGLDRTEQLVAMVQEMGRYPSRTAECILERSFAGWLQRRRADAGRDPFHDLPGRLGGAPVLAGSAAGRD